ncbi:MAG: hypothetical protein HZA31_09985 [Opitutae bacterium]|nr:hypothetical protein [Opitutae bacterium]
MCKRIPESHRISKQLFVIIHRLAGQQSTLLHEPHNQTALGSERASVGLNDQRPEFFRLLAARGKEVKRDDLLQESLNTLSALNDVGTVRSRWSRDCR